ncbi:MAG: IS5/IS1182 family transposase [Thermoplasmata archaeon HGW-Thermoplasmata-1]|nr:MAG: IS5/IS1182 family transposase [Thermoplasmata archaeon HGW-Thermoplasmata-1]
MAKKERWGSKHEDKRNWKDYNRHLVKRGEFYLALNFIDRWLDEIRNMNKRKVGQPFTYPKSMIFFLAMIKQKGFDYRSLEGVMAALSNRVGPFPVISFSQIRRRILELETSFKKKDGKRVAGCDGTGIKVTNRGEWIRQKWDVRRGWIKVTLLGDEKGDILDVEVGNEEQDEREAARTMLERNADDIAVVMMDGLHDCGDTFDKCDELGIKPAIKIRTNASPKGYGPRAREAREYLKKGYKQWSIDKDYGMRWPATEGIFSAVKRVFGESVQSHKPENMYREARLKFWAYQQLRDVN